MEVACNQRGRCGLQIGDEHVVAAVDAIMVEIEIAGLVAEHIRCRGTRTVHDRDAADSVRARGKFFAFGFDDFIFSQDALAGLLTAAEASPNSAVHGYAKWHDAEGMRHFYGKDPIPHKQLLFYNFLANASFLVPRSILDDVGLYDPHIAASRLCDWDLWRRILRKYQINRVPILIGHEYGNTRDDSLGNTYPLIEESMQEYFGADRNFALRSDNFPDLDVWQMPPCSSVLLAAHVSLLRSFFKSRSWAQNAPLEYAVELAFFVGPEKMIFGIFGALPAGATLLPLEHRKPGDHSLLYIPPELSDAQLNYSLAGCSAVIMAQHISDVRSEYVRAMCTLLNIPLYDSSDGRPFPDIIADSQPVNALTWISRLRTALAASGNRVHALAAELAATQGALTTSAQRLEHIETTLKAHSSSFSRAKAQLNSQAFRVAMRLRMLVNWLREMRTWLGFR